MTMNSSGPISLAGTTAGVSIEIENGGNGTTQISLNDSAVRTLAGVPSGAITMPTNFYGKANRVALSYTYSANTANASLNVSSIGGYSAGKSDITITVNSGIYVYSTSVSNAGLTLSGGTSGDTITLVNNGYIMGMGGAGGDTSGSHPHPGGQNGGTAISLGFNTTINNTNGSAYIGGGGGGGSDYQVGGGGGAGGGVGGYTSSDGQGGAPGSAGTDGATSLFCNCGCRFYNGNGGGGGRIFPGTGGAGGARNSAANGGGKGGGSGAGGGGTGGGAGTAGGSGSNAGGDVGSGNPAGAGGGGWGARGGHNNGGSGGGAGGNAVALNGKTVTWTSGDTTRVYGAVA